MTSPHLAVIEGLFRDYDRMAMAAFGKVAHEAKADGTTVTALDRQASDHAIAALRQATPGYAIVSEEEAQPHQLGARYTWVIDPLDGTASFARGYPTWCLGIGLLDGAEPREGYMRFPALNETLTHDGERMLWNGGPVPRHSGPVLPDTHNALVGSGLHSEIPYGKITGYKLRNYGSNLYHMACLALGRADVMISPRSYLWDFAAALPFTRALGMREVTLDGKPLDVAAMLKPGSKFRTPGPVIVGSPEEVEALLGKIGTGR